MKRRRRTPLFLLIAIVIVYTSVATGSVLGRAGDQLSLRSNTAPVRAGERDEASAIAEWAADTLHVAGRGLLNDAEGDSGAPHAVHQDEGEEALAFVAMDDGLLTSAHHDDDQADNIHDQAELFEMFLGTMDDRDL